MRGGARLQQQERLPRPDNNTGPIPQMPAAPPLQQHSAPTTKGRMRPGQMPAGDPCIIGPAVEGVKGESSPSSLPDIIAAARATDDDPASDAAARDRRRPK